MSYQNQEAFTVVSEYIEFCQHHATTTAKTLEAIFSWQDDPQSIPVDLKKYLDENEDAINSILIHSLIHEFESHFYFGNELHQFLCSDIGMSWIERQAGILQKNELRLQSLFGAISESNVMDSGAVAWWIFQELKLIKTIWEFTGYEAQPALLGYFAEFIRSVNPQLLNLDSATDSPSLN